MEVNCRRHLFVTNIIQNIFCAQQKKETVWNNLPSSLNDDRHFFFFFWMNYPFKYIFIGYAISKLLYCLRNMCRLYWQAFTFFIVTSIAMSCVSILEMLHLQR